MKDIKIKTIPHNRQRYDTCGDYWECPKTIQVRISDMKNPDYEFLVALHELIELTLCKKRGIDWKKIDEFDIAFQGEGEPGDDSRAPYFNEHQFATKVEKMVSDEMGVDWTIYDNNILSL